MVKRDQIHQKALKTKDIDLLNQYKQLRNRINKEVKKSKKDYYLEILKTHKSNPYKFWKEIGKLLPNKFRAKSVPKDMNPDDLNKFFSTIGTKTAEMLGPNAQAEPLWKGPDSIHTFKLETVCIDSVIKQLKCLPDRSSCDILNFDGKLLKTAADVIGPQLTHIYLTYI